MESVHIQSFGKRVCADNALAGLKPALRRAVRTLLEDGTLVSNRYVVPRARAEAAAQAAGASVGELADALVPIAALALAHPPVSAFHVGVVSRTATRGDLVLGGNIEYAGAPLSVAVHAEQASLSRAFARDPTGVAAMHMTIVPCGHCRQVIHEADEARPIELRLRGERREIADMLPEPFGPSDLQIDPHAMVSGKRHGLRLAAPCPQGVSERLAHAALEAADRAWAPYSHCYSGLALELPGGLLVSGTVLESAAFNPTVSPVTAAMAEVAATGFALSDIRAAVLVEACASGVTSHGDESAMVLRCANPSLKLVVLAAVASS